MNHHSGGGMCIDQQFDTLEDAQAAATMCGCNPADAHSMSHHGQASHFMVGHGCNAIWHGSTSGGSDDNVDEWAVALGVAILAIVILIAVVDIAFCRGTKGAKAATSTHAQA